MNGGKEIKLGSSRFRLLFLPLPEGRVSVHLYFLAFGGASSIFLDVVKDYDGPTQADAFAVEDARAILRAAL